MRITAEEKQATHRRIVDAALTLFSTNGFEATTTRDIARAAEIGTGTLFNYFDTKEAIVASLAEDAVTKARKGFARQTFDSGFEEHLFGLVAVELRQLKPIRRFITSILETLLCPLVIAKQTEENQALRVGHLETVIEIAHQHGIAEVSPVALQMYWTLYTGVLVFWAADRSPKQEQTLALLDQSLHMFVTYLVSTSNEPR
jgi:AcrR family transcriptional regulator